MVFVPLRVWANWALQKFCKEVITWRSLQHPNILPLLGVVMTGNQFAMVSEWMTNGNINQYVTTHPHKNRFELVSNPFKYFISSAVAHNYRLRQLGGITRGLIHMHGQGMIHGDLKGVGLRGSEPLSFSDGFRLSRPISLSIKPVAPAWRTSA